MELSGLAPKLQHITQNGDAATARTFRRGGLKKRKRCAHRSRVCVVAFVDQREGTAIRMFQHVTRTTTAFS
ncbi:hypothetical protein D9M69_644510 [compost metagenome]